MSSETLPGIAHVRGAQAAPFYAWVREQTTCQPDWNFNKVLIGRDGRIAGTFGARDEPGGPKLSQAIEVELAKA
jgi:glutathione peroxidase